MKIIVVAIILFMAAVLMTAGCETTSATRSSSTPLSGVGIQEGPGI